MPGSVQFRKWTPPPFASNAVVLLALAWLSFAVCSDGGHEIRLVHGCDHPLGMESGRIPDANITASSSFNDVNVGPQNARLCVERDEGAWCPREIIKQGVYEWLQVDLGQDFLLTAVAAQGRFGNGHGREFADHFRVEYARRRGGRGVGDPRAVVGAPAGRGEQWVRYRQKNGSEVFSGNRNTYMVEKRYLDPPVVASLVRIVPHTFHHRTVCMRIELYGCPYSGGLDSYEIPASADELTFEAQPLLLADDSYDGRKSRVAAVTTAAAGSSAVTSSSSSSSGFYRDGLGQLTDGLYGPRDVTEDRGYDWVGWKNSSTSGGDLELTFTFKTARVLHELVLHAANIPAFGIGIFARVLVYVVDPVDGDDRSSTTERLVAEKHFTADVTRDFVRNVSVTIPSPTANAAATAAASTRNARNKASDAGAATGKPGQHGNNKVRSHGNKARREPSAGEAAVVGKVVKVRLRFGDEWIFLSEVVFHSEEVDPDNPAHVSPAAKNFSLTGFGNNATRSAVVSAGPGGGGIKSGSPPSSPSSSSSSESGVADVKRSGEQTNKPVGYGNDKAETEFIDDDDEEEEDEDPAREDVVTKSSSSTPPAMNAPHHPDPPSLWSEILIVSMTLAGVVLVGLAVVCAVRAMLGHWPQDPHAKSGAPAVAVNGGGGSLGGIHGGFGGAGNPGGGRHSWFTKKTYQMDSARADLDRAQQATCRISLTNDQIVTVGSEYSALDRTTLCTEYSLLDDNFCQAPQTLQLQLQKQQQPPHLWQSAKDVSNLSSPESIYTDTYSAEYASPLIANLPAARSSFHAKSPSTPPPRHFLLPGMKPSATTGALSTFQPGQLQQPQNKIDLLCAGSSGTSGSNGSSSKVLATGYGRSKGSGKSQKRKQEQPYATTDILCINNNNNNGNGKGKQMHQPQVFFLTQRDSQGELSFSPFQQQASWSTGNIFDGPRHQQQQQ